LWKKSQKTAGRRGGGSLTLYVITIRQRRGQRDKQTDDLPQQYRAVVASRGKNRAQLTHEITGMLQTL